MGGPADIADAHAARRPVMPALERARPFVEERSVEMPKAPAPVVPQTIAEIIRGTAFSRPRRAYPTGIPDLDAATGGLRSRQQSLMVAPTGVGKTSLVGTLMRGLASAGVPIFWLCTELDAEEQAVRFVANALRARHGGCVTADSLLRHEMPIEQVAQVVDGLPIYVTRWRRSSGDAFALMREHMNAIAQRHGVPPVGVIDYLQKLATEDADRRRQSVGLISEQSLEIAQDLDTHMMAISSVSRAYYNATARKLRKAAEDEDPRDWLAAGKEAGELEYDAAMLMYLDVGDEANAIGERPARLILAKSRQGGEGFYGLRFHGPSGLFLADTTAASQMKAGQKQAVAGVNLDKIKTEFRRLVMKKRTPFTSRNAIAELIKGNRTDKLRALEEMFDSGELVQAGQRQPITFVPPAEDDRG
jgi:replicative DNA helicase